MYPLVHFPIRIDHGLFHVNHHWEQDMGLNGLVSKPLWLHYRYTGDTDFLRRIAYPVLRECSRFYVAYLTEGKAGRLDLIPSVSPEHWGLTAGLTRNRNCTSALTLCRYCLRAAAAAARTLGEDEAEASTWLAAAARLAPYPTSPTPTGPIWVDVEDAPPIKYNIAVPLSPVFWGDDVGLDSPPEMIEIARRTFEHIQGRQSVYAQSAVRPRLGLLPPTPPGPGGMGPEYLLLSYQSIRLFPGVPPETELVMENFAAEGGFRVSAVHQAKGDIRDVRMKSCCGGPCRLANPWPGRAVAVTTTHGTEVASAEGAATHIVFETRPGEVYLVRPR
jgi:hypothetical protein